MTNRIPEICYEEPDENAGSLSSHIPFIQVPEGEAMPGMLFIFESRDSGEFEPDSEGNPLPIVEMELHQFADMVTLKNKLDPAAYDDVRAALGLESLAIASEKGRQVTQNIRENVE